MAQAEIQEVLNVDSEKLYQAITHYERYPEFVEGCQYTEVKRISPQQAQVSYHLQILSQDVKYVLKHDESSDHCKVEWTLMESNFFKKNIGKWELKPLGVGKTQVRYSLEVEFKVPVPGFIVNRLVKGTLPGVVKSFAQQASRLT